MYQWIQWVILRVLVLKVNRLFISTFRYVLLHSMSIIMFTAWNSITPVQEENSSSDLEASRLRATDDNLAAKLIKKRLGNTTALRRRRFILSDEEKEEARRKNTTARRRHRALLSVEGSALVKEKDIASTNSNYLRSKLSFIKEIILTELNCSVSTGRKRRQASMTEEERSLERAKNALGEYHGCLIRYETLHLIVEYSVPCIWVSMWACCVTSEREREGRKGERLYYMKRSEGKKRDIDSER